MIQKLPSNSLGAVENSLGVDEEEVFVFPLSYSQQRLWFASKLAYWQVIVELLMLKQREPSGEMESELSF